MSVETSIEEIREKHLQPFEEVATFFSSSMATMKYKLECFSQERVFRNLM
jgi:hypothetical protein